MAEETYIIPEDPKYDPSIRKLQDSDPASASGVLNPLIQKIVGNIAAVKVLADGKAALDADGKVPTGQLPAMDYDPKGSAAKVREEMDDRLGDIAAVLDEINGEAV